MSQPDILLVAAILFLVTKNTCQGFSQSQEQPSTWIPEPQVPIDEFNTTEQPPKVILDSTTRDYPLRSLKLILLRVSYDNCCLPWSNLIQQSELQDDLRKRFGRGRHILKASDLLTELKITFLNVTFLSIDGQPGENEREKYYSFYDGIQYYLRLMKVATGYLNETTASTTTTTTNQIDFDRYFKRQLNSVKFRASQDPVVTSFLSELRAVVDGVKNNFELYEDFLRYTEFGQYYAHNISMIREASSVFNQIHSHLTNIHFLGNFTRPSKQYMIIRRMSYELYRIRNDIVQEISVRVRQNRADARSIFTKLNELSEARPYIRMLGDEFSPIPPYFAAHVRQLTHLLDLYLFNNLTHLSFYDRLADLPQEFIILGSNIAHFYENKEIIQFDKFDFEFFPEPSPVVHNTTSFNTTSPKRIEPKNATVARRISNMMSNIFDF